MKILAEGITDKGLSRNNNEDDFCIDPETGFFAVADGVGGSASGEVASRTSMKVISEYVRSASPRERYPAAGSDSRSGMLKRLTAGINLANVVICDASGKDTTLQGMGTTVAAVMIEGSRMSIAHVGDSRVYLIRAGVIAQLTDDHSLVAEQVKAGLITKEEAETSSMRNIITRALGQEETVDIDSSEIALMDGDRIVLCTDGLTTMVLEAAILATVLSHDEPGYCCRALVDLANKNGGKDNVTVVVIYLKKHSAANIIPKLFRLKRR
jgi:protein phosphatase